MFLRIGRTVINSGEVVKVVNDSKRNMTIIHFKNGSKVEYKKHAKAVWDYFKGATVSKAVAAPSASSSSRSRW